MAEATGTQLYVGVSDPTTPIPYPFLLAFPRLPPDYEAVPWRRQAHQCTASNRNPEGLSHISTLRAHLNDVERGGISSLLQIRALEQRGLLLSPAGPLLVLTTELVVSAAVRRVCLAHEKTFKMCVGGGCCTIAIG